MDDVRFATPLYTLAEAARILDVPAATFQTWARGYIRRPAGRPPVVGRPIVTAFAPTGRQASVPFVGLAEGFVLAAIRKQGVPLQRIRPALAALDKELGLEHVLASKRLYTDGAEVLFDYAEHSDDPSARELVVVRHGQRVFSEVIESYLRRVTFAADGWASRIRLPQYGRAEVIADPRFRFGQAAFVHGRATVTDVLERFWAGEGLDTLSEEFGVPKIELEDAVRVASRRAA